MPEASQSILEVIQEKERELSTLEADAKEDAIALLEQAERAAAEFLHEQTLRVRDEATMLYEQRVAEIQQQKEELLTAQAKQLREMEKHFQQRFQSAVNQVIEWVWDTAEAKTETAEMETAANMLK